MTQNRGSFSARLVGNTDDWNLCHSKWCEILGFIKEITNSRRWFRRISIAYHCSYWSNKNCKEIHRDDSVQSYFYSIWNVNSRQYFEKKIYIRKDDCYNTWTSRSCRIVIESKYEYQYREWRWRYIVVWIDKYRFIQTLLHVEVKIKAKKNEHTSIDVARENVEIDIRKFTTGMWNRCDICVFWGNQFRSNMNSICVECLEIKASLTRIESCDRILNLLEKALTENSESWD